jgi:hypothetical protein
MRIAMAIRKPSSSSSGVPVYSRLSPATSVFAHRKRRTSVASQKR